MADSLFCAIVPPAARRLKRRGIDGVVKLAVRFDSEVAEPCAARLRNRVEARVAAFDGGCERVLYAGEPCIEQRVVQREMRAPVLDHNWRDGAFTCEPCTEQRQRIEPRVDDDVVDMRLVESIQEFATAWISPRYGIAIFEYLMAR